MLAFEQSHHRQHAFDHSYTLDNNIQAPYPGVDMDQYQATSTTISSYDSMATYHPLPFSYFENPAIFATAPNPSLKQEMHRTASSQSVAHQYSNQQEIPPALISSASGPSVPSASSSTVGSPYSGPAHNITSQQVYTNDQAGYGLGLYPTIVNQEGYSQELMGASLDTDLPMATNKLSDNFVGECADLSSTLSRSSTRHDASVSQSALSFVSDEPLNLSANPLVDETCFNQPTPGSTSVPSRRSSAPSKAVIISTTTVKTPPLGLSQIAVFKSPSTPASAYQKSSATQSPVSVRASIPTSVTNSPVHVRPERPQQPQQQQQRQRQRQVSQARIAKSGPTPMSQHDGRFQNHFFAQSSGSFMPPLESSYPSLISANQSFGEVAYPEQALYATNPIHTFSGVSPIGSPAPSPHHYQPYVRTQFSPPITHETYTQQPPYMSRRPSVTSYLSGGSHGSPLSEYDDDGREKGRCPHPDCGKVFKDLKAHMLTHQAERPEKCPILNCEYNQKGFARKYDKNRHTLTHYKGTMVCGFCPGSGSAAEKSFNRADVFKRHLTSMHGVEQTPPNSRKRSPSASTKKLSSYCQDATGICSTCSATFNNAQDFYEHLDDCVLRVVQQEEPSEAINAQHLKSTASDEQVQETLDRHMIKTEDHLTTFEDDEEEDDDDNDEEDDEPSFHNRSGKGNIRSGKLPTSNRVVLTGGVSKSGRPSKKGMTWSKGGVPLVGKGRKKRKHYPPSWGMSAEKMQMKKRVLCVYDGSRRLWKDDMMLHNEFEVRMKLPDGKSYVTDLDVETLKRAEAFHNATEAERGPYLPQLEDEVYDGFDYSELIA